MHRGSCLSSVNVGKEDHVNDLLEDILTLLFTSSKAKFKFFSPRIAESGVKLHVISIL